MPIKVLIVDDSPIAVALVKRALYSVPDILVVGTAQNGRDALKLIPALKPDVVCTDLHMPVLNGLELTRQIMALFPRPVLVLSVSTEEGSLDAFNMMEAGALDVVAKPRVSSDAEFLRIRDELVAKVRILSGVRVFRKYRKYEESGGARAPVANAKPPRLRLVVIGASTGGPQALQLILSRLPADFPAPVVCVQHISLGFQEGLMQWLSGSCALRIKTAREGDVPVPGTVCFPPEGMHLEFQKNGSYLISSRPPCNGHRPSVSTTMSSAAQRYGNAAAGVLLTGMGDDGAQGMLDLYQAGALTIAQDQGSSVVFGMPKQAIELGAARLILPLEGIAAHLVHQL
ncbi:chemotaxis-specific protein-glutamate methyltransferase CheB [Citrifermentans bremense]|uniref:chemotaxis-specific protein-glutamate methyltransferase CheB n=1 Tax=Citrifermentans bremense TaxID=60035 RepID=UPI0003F78288|nr:chemotaxis-specific protein-glutamate methyltransferase CheB [Citrifermentans bremense]